MGDKKRIKCIFGMVFAGDELIGECINVKGLLIRIRIERLTTTINVSWFHSLSSILFCLRLLISERIYMSISFMI